MEKFRVFASCHNHSTFSDGEYTPRVLARMAKNLGHGAIILTDHDTVQGYPFIKEACDEYGLKTRIGVELSTFHKSKDGRMLGVHLCGFDFDPEHEAVRDFIPYCASIQTDRTRELFRMAREAGTIRDGLAWEDVLRDHPYHNYICNNEVFASFVKRGIYLYSEYDEFFRTSGFAHDKEREEKVRAIIGKSYMDISTSEAIKRVKAAGGVPVVAHPRGLNKYVDEFIDIGVMGFETRHSMLSPENRDFFEDVCKKNKLYNLGGSDHENILGGLLGFDTEEYSTPYETSGVDEDAFMRLYERKLG